VDSVRSPAGPKKRANTPGEMPARSRIPRSDVAPPAGFEPALPPPEAGKTPIIPISGVSPFRFAWSRSHELQWYPAVHCTNPCTTSTAGHVQRTESALRRPRTRDADRGRRQRRGPDPRWPSGSRAGCWSLRTDAHTHRALPKDSELARAIAVLACAQDATWWRTKATNELRSLLREYHSGFLAAFAGGNATNLASPDARAVLAIAPTPAAARPSWPRPASPDSRHEDLLARPPHVWAMASSRGYSVPRPSCVREDVASSPAVSLTPPSTTRPYPQPPWLSTSRTGTDRG
jgi:hypothetical protein